MRNVDKQSLLLLLVEQARRARRLAAETTDEDARIALLAYAEELDAQVSALEAAATMDARRETRVMLSSAGSRSADRSTWRGAPQSHSAVPRARD